MKNDLFESSLCDNPPQQQIVEIVEVKLIIREHNVEASEALKTSKDAQRFICMVGRQASDRMESGP